MDNLAGEDLGKPISRQYCAVDASANKDLHAAKESL